MQRLLKSIVAAGCLAALTASYAATCWTGAFAYCALQGETVLWYVAGCTSSITLTATANASVSDYAVTPPTHGLYGGKAWTQCQVWWSGTDCHAQPVWVFGQAKGYYAATFSQDCNY